MATVNPFDLLVDDDAEDPSQLIAAAQKAAAVSQAKAKTAPPTKGLVAAPAQDKPSAKLPSKPLPPAEATVSGRPTVKFETGYTVETVFDRSKLGSEPYSVEVLPNGELLILDSENSNIYSLGSTRDIFFDENCQCLWNREAGAE